MHPCLSRESSGPATPFSIPFGGYNQQICQPGQWKATAGGDTGLPNTSSNYLGSPELGGVSCQYVGNPPCLECEGSWNISLWGDKGSLNGNVRVLPSNTPAPQPLQVAVRKANVGDYIDAAGHYDMLDGMPPAWVANNWAVGVPDPIESGPGRGRYFVEVVWPIYYLGGEVDIVSSQATSFDIGIPASYFEESPRCATPPPTGPGPSSNGEEEECPPTKPIKPPELPWWWHVIDIFLGGPLGRGWLWPPAIPDSCNCA